MRAALKRPDNIKIPPHIVRKDLGDMDGLCAMIGDLGVFQPVVVDPDDNLVCGYRRLCAAKRLGHEYVNCVVAEDAGDVRTALRMQMAENVGRKDFTPSEKVELGRLIEAAEARGAAKPDRLNGSVRAGTETVNVPTDVDPAGPFSNAAKTAAAEVGMSPVTYAKAKEVVDAAAKEPEKFGDVRAAMDKTGEVAPAHRAVQERKTKADSLKDAKGVEVPLLLRDVFGDRKWSREALESMRLVARDLEATARAVQARAAAYPWIPLGAVLERLRGAISFVDEAEALVEANQPHAVCVCCKGKGKVTTATGVSNCPDCRGCGWLPEHRWDELHGE